ncbi:McrB family protein [Alishewanella sp. d11]|uniref:McrB family protein n=1 Tax=Alishewanella sp. d11 TaxID=3414030 RepID=UPI003BF8B312
MVCFSYQQKSCEVTFRIRKDTNVTELTNNLTLLSKSEVLAKVTVEVFHLFNDLGYNIEIRYAKRHTDSGNPELSEEKPKANASAISFFLKGEDGFLARIRFPQNYSIGQEETQDAWWFIDTDTNGIRDEKFHGRIYGQFLKSGVEIENSLSNFYKNLAEIHKLQIEQRVEKINHQIQTSTSQEVKMHLNTIKYGPPGTGKTYSLVNDIKFLLQLTEKEDETEISSIADLKHVLGHKIEFFTFHQSYSYEDFIEGIKAEITETQQVNYAVKNGIFKKISRRAYLDKLFSQNSDQTISDKDKKACLDLYAENTDKCLSYFAKNDETHLANKILRIIEKKSKSESSTTVTPKYVLCIDEINRGNLSRIFGELITCIEKTKRHGGGETIPVTLPYSGDLFVVPDNLYIIGTMNTADRSLVKLDNAMRRRFNFELIKPDASLLNTNVDGVNLENFLNVVNARIRQRLGIDFELGHAYFMCINNRADFEMVIKNNIIPLLNEYFFNNNASVQEILQNTDADPYLDR